MQETEICNDDVELDLDTADLVVEDLEKEINPTTVPPIGTTE